METQQSIQSRADALYSEYLRIYKNQGYIFSLFILVTSLIPLTIEKYLNWSTFLESIMWGVPLATMLSGVFLVHLTNKHIRVLNNLKPTSLLYLEKDQPVTKAFILSKPLKFDTSSVDSHILFDKTQPKDTTKNPTTETEEPKSNGIRFM